MQNLTRRWLIGLISVCFLTPAFAQIKLTFPTDRAVFQRTNANRATISISGSYSQPVDRIEAQVTQIKGGTNRTWTTIATNPQGGIFSGTLEVDGGWYKLEVRGLLNGTPVGSSSTVDHVGAGEVFVVSGQSNAQGFRQPDQRDPSDERVIRIDYRNANSSSSDAPFPNFAKITAAGDIAPFGESAWAWGPLGDLLTARLNVPVLFINTAFGSTTANNWLESSKGQRTLNVYCAQCGEAGYFPTGMPYGNLKLALNVYVPMLGVRAVLWHQGETDTFPGQTSTDSYREALKYVINTSRNDAGKNVAWMVARASLTAAPDSKSGMTSQAIIDAQNQVLEQIPNSYPGPYMDNVQNPRVNNNDFTHFSGQGLYDAAQAWSNSMNDAFFSTTPYPAAGFVPVSIACAGNAGYTLTVQGNNPSWSNGQEGSSITVGAGTYYGKVRDASGNQLITQPVFVPQPVIVPQSATEFCQGGNVKLVASAYTNISWSNGSTATDITVSTSGIYSVSLRDQLGCTLQSSVEVKVNPLPDQPRITALSDTVFCRIGFSGERNSVVLRSPENVSYEWKNSTGAAVSSNRDLTVTESQSFRLAVIDGKGCKSPQSSAVAVRVNPNPGKPIISPEGPTTFCADENVRLTSSAADGNRYLWDPLPDVTTRTATVNKAGSYTVRVYNSFGCISVVSDPVNIKVNPLPDVPLVAASGPLSFCDRESVTLCTTNPLRTAWVESANVNTILATAPCYVAGTTGSYRVRVTDANNCKNFSVPVVVTVKPLPDKPVVEQIGTYTLQATANQPGDATGYRWVVNNTDTITTSSKYRTQIIKTPEEGLYKVQASITYTGVPNIPSGTLTCRSDFSDARTYFFDPNNRGLSIYPNPNRTGDFIIETQEDWQNAQVLVYTLSGQLVFSDVVGVFDERKRVQLHPLPGTYVLRVSAEGFSVTKRVLVIP